MTTFLVQSGLEMTGKVDKKCLLAHFSCSPPFWAFLRGFEGNLGHYRAILGSFVRKIQNFQKMSVFGPFAVVFHSFEASQVVFNGFGTFWEVFGKI